MSEPGPQPPAGAGPSPEETNPAPVHPPAQKTVRETPVAKNAGVPTTLMSAGPRAVPPFPREAFPASSPPGYEVLELLGRGGMGVVYRARQLNLNRVVALKMVGAGAEATREERTRFRAEAEAVARLQHPHIVQIHEVGEHDGRPYLALEYVGGGSLASRLNGTPLPHRTAASLVQTLAGAVEAAHRAAVVHRDLKPANVLLMAGSDGAADPTRPKVADFGLAKLLDDAGRTLDGTILGTPSYMAPEQAAGRTREVGPVTDVYALGAILYECLTGRPPFRAADARETMQQVLRNDPVAPRELQPGVPRDLENVCLKCLQKEAGHRYASAAELAADLGRYLADQPVRACRRSAFHRAAQFGRRNKLLAGATAAVVVSLATGLVIASLGRARASQAERETRRLLTASYARAAELAARRGAWREALENDDRALSAGHPESVSLRLAKVRAWLALDDADAAARGLEELAAEADAGPLAGQIALWRADLALLRARPRDVPRHLAAFQEALDRGLPPAEAEYARGMLATTLPEAETRLRQAVELDPFHQRARALLAGLYLVLARYADARQQIAIAETLFPEDPTFPVISSYVLILENRPGAAVLTLDRARDRLGPRRYASARNAGEAFRAMQQFLNRWVRDPAAFGPLQLATSGVPVLMKVNGLPDGLSLPLHPILAAGVTATDRPSLELARQLLSNGWTTEQAETLARVWPEGLAFLLCGWKLGSAGRWDDAETALRRAADAPSIVNLRRIALSHATVAAYIVATRESKDRDPQVRERFRQGLRELAALGDLPLSEAAQLTPLAMRMEEYDLVRPILAAWEKLAPADLEAQRWRATLEFHTHAYAEAARTAERILKRKPEHEGARAIREASVEHLRNDAKALAPAD